MNGTNYSNSVYGWDELSKIMIVLGIGFMLTIRGLFLGIILIVLSIVRSKSHNISKRAQEMMYYQNIKTNIKKVFYTFINKNFFRNIKNNIKNMKKNMKNKKYFSIVKCPNCSQKLRLPKNKGNILVTCPRCLFKFKLRT